MTFVYFSVAMGVVLVTLHLRYRSKSASQMPTERPSFCWQPKFVVEFELPDAITTATDPVNSLGDSLGQYGFKEVRQQPDSVMFARGHTLGDFSIKIAKVTLTFPLPLEKHQSAEAGYGSYAVAFDTGDLWTFTVELRDKVAAL